MSLQRAIVPALLTVLGAVTGQAALIYSNFGSSYVGSYSVWGTNTDGGLSMASAFTPTFDAELTSVTIAADYFSGSSAFLVEVAADSGGLPGTVLESDSVSLPSSNGYTNQTTVFASQTLDAGTQYWIILAADPGNPGAEAEWYMNPNGASGGAEYIFGAWTLLDAAAPLLEVDGSTPEPSTVALFAAGIGGLFVAGKRRNAQGRKARKSS